MTPESTHDAAATAPGGRRVLSPRRPWLWILLAAGLLVLSMLLRELVLALGEVTGHAHAVQGPGRLHREAGPFGPMLLHLPEGGRVVHEEHAAIALPKGWFRVVRQREYAPGAVRIIAD